MSVTRTKIIKIRATDDEYAELVARSTKPKLAEWMRDTCLGAETRSTKSAKTPRIDPTLLRQLSGLGNNLNQIARAINSHEWKPIDRIQIVAALTTIQRELARLKAENSHDR